jgi:pimeloyl-ACP methyl ester carboxylesterase
MLSQTRSVLNKYAAAGGRYEELVIADVGHSPNFERPTEFNRAFHAHISR